MEEHNMLKTILNGLDSYVYAAVPETGELLFVNDRMKEKFNLNDDYGGIRCYELFQKDKTERCAFCPRHRLDEAPDDVIVWEERNGVTGNVCRNTDSYIDWPDGRKVHLQHSVDITDMKKAVTALDRQLEEQALMTGVFQSFLSGENLDGLITNALREIGEFMAAAQILLYITEDDENTFICRNEWINPKQGLSSRIGDVLAIAPRKRELFSQLKGQERFYITSDDPGVREAMAPYRVNFQKYLSAGIFLGDQVYAILDFAMEDDAKQWTRSDINMVALATNILTGAFLRQSVENQLVAAKELAEETSRYKSSFLAAVSHEIRTPMNTILGIAEIQLQKEDQPRETEDAFLQIYDSGDLLLNIINDILDMSRIEAGKLELTPVKYDVPSLVYDTAQLVHLRYESKPIEFVIRVDENTPLDLFGDELRVKQVLNNLLSNAFKYTDEGEVEFSVSAELQGGTDVTLVLSVRDTGQGMSAEQLKNLFRRYTRFNVEANRAVVGAGLGMNITKNLVELMRGEIFVESVPNKGSLFTVRLPQTRFGFAVCGAEMAEKLRCFRTQNISKVKNLRIRREHMPYGSVLIVDDVKSNLNVAKVLLSPYRLRVDTAGGGREAIGKIKRGNQYDIVFMDHMMPAMDGVEATEILRGMGYTRPIVALTANALAGQAEMFLKKGFDGYISKPIDSRELDAMLHELIRAKQPAEVIAAARREHALNGGAAARKAPEQFDMGVMRAFVSDAEDVIDMLEEIDVRRGVVSDENRQLYITGVHGMKSALANIGEEALSATARRLEQAGREGDLAVLSLETPAFLDALRSLILKVKPPEDADADAAVSDADKAYLREKLLAVQTACRTFDIITAKAALDALRERTWPRRTTGALDAIAADLLHSAFKKAAEGAEAALGSIQA